MKDKLYEPARHNEKAPAEGMAAVNTHNPEEEPIEQVIADQEKQTPGEEQANDQTTEQFRKTDE
jgi:hypothetical protein